MISELEKMVNELVRKNGSERSAILWLIGYSGSLECEINRARAAFHLEPRRSLKKILKVEATND